MAKHILSLVVILKVKKRRGVFQLASQGSELAGLSLKSHPF